MLNLQFVIVLAFAASCSCVWHEVRLPWNPVMHANKEEHFYKFWRRNVLKKLIRVDYDTWFKHFRMHTMHTPPLEKTHGSNFSCPPVTRRNPYPPQTVHELTPADIKVVAAIGDSMTAAFGARSPNLADLYVEYRDIAWSIGGFGSLEQATTLPNILKKYNPSVYGSSNWITAVGELNKKDSGFNFAVSGSTSEVVKERVEELISEMKESKSVDFKRDWKLLTIYIGTHDLCMSCFDSELTPRNFMKEISKTLEEIKEKLPKVLVNLVQVFDVTKFHQLPGGYCAAFHEKICPCASVGATRRAMMSRAARDYSMMLNALVRSPKFKNDPDFTVVLQPFLQNAELPKLPNGTIDRTYLAPDCFHWSAKGHAAMATALWNNMLQPVGQKSKSWNVDDGLSCPRSDFPYIFTNVNSKLYYSGKSFGCCNNKEQPSIKIRVQSKSRANEKEQQERKEKGESQKETRAAAILITAGIVMVAVAAGIVVHIAKQRKKNSVEIAPRRNYHTMLEQDTQM